MKSKMILITVLSIFLSIESISGQSNDTFMPLPCDKFKDFKASVRKLLMLQKSKYAPASFEVTDEYMRWSKDKVKSDFISGASWVGTDVKTVYYEYITDLKIAEVRQGYEVVFRTPNEKGWFHLIYINLEICIEAYSVLKCKVDSYGK